MALDPEAQAAGVRLIAYDTLGSTNAEALAHARLGERGPLWITARRQTAGRGRRGSAWTSEQGNLFASLLLTDPAPPDRAAELSFVASLALYDAIADIAPRLREGLSLKWPNDLLVAGAKFAGILIEGETLLKRPLAVVIGIGVNCAHHPQNTLHPATSLAKHDVTVTAEQLLERLAGAMRGRLAQWDRGAGFGAIRFDWLALAAGIGSEIRVRLPDRELTGKFETLDDAGRLMLRLPAGTLEPITAGEVFAAVRWSPGWSQVAPSGS